LSGKIYIDLYTSAIHKTLPNEYIHNKQLNVFVVQRVSNEDLFRGGQK